MSRSFGATPLTTRSPIAIRPPEISSSPAIIRKSVDLPQPEGPTSTQNSPSSTPMSTPCTTSVEPKLLRTALRVTDAMRVLDLPGSRVFGKISEGEGRLAAPTVPVKGIRMKERFSIDRASFPGPVLVTGAGGCIGSWVLALLVRAGVPACALDLSEDKRRPRLLIAESDLEKIAWRTGDISESKTVVQVFETVRPCAVIHLAALQVPFCKADPVAGAKVNVVGTVNVFEAARRLGIARIAYASSIAAHGAMDEGHGAMHTLYGAYKYCDEQIAKVYSEDWKVASVGIHAVSREREGAPVFDMNGVYAPVEEGLRILRQLAPSAAITSSGKALAFPMHLPDEPLRAQLGNYGNVPLAEGIRETYEAFQSLIGRGLLSMPESA